MKYDVVRDERDKFKTAAQDALFLRMGHTVQKPSPGAQELRDFTLTELARECLRVAGQSTSGNSMEMVGRSMTSSDFPYLLAAGANKSLFSGFDTQSETWQVWCGIGSAPDFKTCYVVRPGEADDLDEVPESTEYQYGTRTETRESYNVVTYGKLFAITRQAIINDDLSALSDIPARHGEACARKIGDITYAVLTDNGNLSDGTALFDSSRGNYVSPGAAPAVSTLAAGEASMATMTDLSGKRRLNIRPVFFSHHGRCVAPVKYYLTAHTTPTLAMPHMIHRMPQPGSIRGQAAGCFRCTKRDLIHRAPPDGILPVKKERPSTSTSSMVCSSPILKREMDGQQTEWSTKFVLTQAQPLSITGRCTATPEFSFLGTDFFCSM